MWHRNCPFFKVFVWEGICWWWWKSPMNHWHNKFPGEEVLENDYLCPNLYPPRPLQGNIKLYSGFWTWEGCIEYITVYIHWKTTSTKYHSAEAYVDQTQVLTHRSKPEFLWDVTTNAFARILGLYVGWLTPGWSLWNLGEVVQVECENPCNAITLSCIALILWWFPTKKQANLKSCFFKKIVTISGHFGFSGLRFLWYLHHGAGSSLLCLWSTCPDGKNHGVLVGSA